MALLSTPRLLVGGTFSGVGKSLLTTGLVVALRKRGLSVSCCLSGQAFQQASIYHRISRRYTRTLDRRMLKPYEVLAALSQAGLGADLVLIDGQGGLYDGIGPGDARGSDAEIAILSRTPVVLVADLPEYANSVAALVKGYCQFTSGSLIKALVGNRMGSFSEADPFLPNPALVFLNEALHAYNLPTSAGGLPRTSFQSPLPPPSVYQEVNHTALPMQFLLDIGSLTENHVDIDRLLDIAKAAPRVEFQSNLPDPVPRRCRFAVTDDSCFGPCYQDNLDLLRYFGAEMVPFSPLLDMHLPRDIGGIYLTGAYLKTYGEELSRNDQMRDAILEFAEAGGVVFSEGAGTAFLCRTFQLERGGPQYPGVGLIPGDAAPMHNPAVLLDATTEEDSVLGGIGLKIQGFSTGEWGLRGLSAGATGQIFHILRVNIDGVSLYNEGYSASSQSCSTFNFLHFGSQPSMAQSLVEAAAVAASS
jgi:cobyrinic acid a,c-diamide synthase